jgi:MOSC domain-containing protein YiiM
MTLQAANMHLNGIFEGPSDDETLASSRSRLAVAGVFAGTARHYWDGKPPTAIRKIPIIGPISVNKLGIVGDQQADNKVHGGPEKAIHMYPIEHYRKWKEELPNYPFKFRAGSFGENLSVRGILENSACIGDLFELGSCVLQITQGRTPCWKLAAHVGNPEFAGLFLRSGRTGWYARVVVPGDFLPSDSLALLDRPNPRRTVFMVTKERVSNCTGRIKASRLAELEGLSQNWTLAFSKMADAKVAPRSRGNASLEVAPHMGA